MSGIVTIKIGGKAAEQEPLVRALAGDIQLLRRESQVLLVHGGGAEVTRLSRQLGIEPVFRGGVRVTSAEEMDIVEMVLAGKVGKRLVRTLQSCGLQAVGLSGADGGIFLAQSLGREGEERTCTGTVSRVRVELLALLLDKGYLPVLCSTSMDERGRGINVNADTVAFELASALKSETLLFLSDTPGVLKDGRVLPRLDREEAEREIRAGRISGGMIPKVTSCLEALEKGARSIIIGQYEAGGDLPSLMRGEKGTRISLD